MSTCKYKEYDYECDYAPGDTGDGYCILHSPKSEKKKESFDAGLEDHRTKHGDRFIGFVFPASFTLRGRQFSQDADFRRATFNGDAEFSYAEFEGSVDFRNAEFSRDVYFAEAKFRKDANFGDTTFSGLASFLSAKFLGQVKFIKTAFSVNADFRRAKFNGDADFMHAKFNGDADFRRAKFRGDTTFDSAEFTQDVRFPHATFSGGTVFNHAKFSGDASFKGTMFGGGVVFNHTKFSGDASFMETTFSEGAEFYLATFTQYVHFKRAKFLGRTLFASRIDDDELVQIFPGTEVRAECDFRDVLIAPLDAIVFRDVNLTRCRFQGTDVRNVEFTGAEWPQIVGEKWPGIIRRRWPTIWRRAGIYDEIVLLPGGGTRDWHHIEKLYRELKQNYEDRRDYERAGDFHYGEKEMRRKNPKTSLGLRILLTLYWLVSGYGERYARPLISAAVLVVTCAVLYLCLGLHPKSGGPPLDLMSVWDWLRSAFYSFRVMTLLRPGDLAPMGYAKLVHALESLLGPVLIGLFALAIRQKLRR